MTRFTGLMVKSAILRLPTWRILMLKADTSRTERLERWKIAGYADY
jgi:hypothetical protein